MNRIFFVGPFVTASGCSRLNAIFVDDRAGSEDRHRDLQLALPAVSGGFKYLPD